MFLTIVTPTYNRAHLLQRLYKSLCAQTCQDFVWLVIDDGSTDNTFEMFSAGEGFMPTLERCSTDENKWVGHFSREGMKPSPALEYVCKPNGGKHTALNVAFGMVQTELLFIVDSDDWLTPDAVATIKEDWEKVKSSKGEGRDICGLGYLRGYSPTKVIGDEYSKDGLVSNFIDERYNRGTDGDKAEVWVTACLRQFRYPEHEGERFISESVAWIWLAERYDMVFRNKIIYVTEYLPGGLSDNGRRLRFQCPHLMAYGSLMTMTRRFSLKIRIKETLLYIVYSLFGHFGWRKIFCCRYKPLVTLCAIPGWLLYRYWKHKYMSNTTN